MDIRRAAPAERRGYPSIEGSASRRRGLKAVLAVLVMALLLLAAAPGALAADPTITVTAPSGTGSYAAGDRLPVSWNADAPLASGEFSIWVVSPANGWYVGKVVPANGNLTYADSVTLSVPADAGYRVFVCHRATTATPGASTATAPGASPSPASG